jgi:iron-sulfur cluster assembly accessory protein
MIKKNKKFIITKDTNINEIIMKYPQLTEVFMNYGLHCIGCSMAGWETIEQGALAHGMNKKEIDNIIKELNNQTQLTKTNDESPFKITSRAEEQVSKLIKKSPSAKYLRIKIIEFPLGHKYGFKFEKNKKKNDILVTKKKVSFLINKKDFNILKGSRMDYLSYILGNGFKIYSPNKFKNN